MNYRYWNCIRFRFPTSGNVTRTKKHLDFCCFKSLSRKDDKRDFRDLSKKLSMKQEIGNFFFFFLVSALSSGNDINIFGVN